MWKPRLATSQGRFGTERAGAMAHRRAVGGWRLAGGILGLVCAAVLLAGSVWISNQVTGLRAEISRLESRREFLEAGAASLMMEWNKATAPSVIAARAESELGFVCPPEPDLVLVEVRGSDEKISAWRRLLATVGGAAPAHAATVTSAMTGNMVSLSPLAKSAIGGGP